MRCHVPSLSLSRRCRPFLSLPSTVSRVSPELITIPQTPVIRRHLLRALTNVYVAEICKKNRVMRTNADYDTGLAIEEYGFESQPL